MKQKECKLCDGTGTVPVGTENEAACPNKCWLYIENDIEDIDDYDCYFQDFETCPYCGEKDEDCWEHAGNNDGDELIVECSECGKKYIMITNIRMTYTTKKLGKVINA